MARKPEPETTQDEPTRPRPVDENGRTLDRWGLPLGGPARIAALDGRTDPNLDTEGWRDTPAPPAPETEPVVIETAEQED